MAKAHGMLLEAFSIISTSPRSFCPLHRRLCSRSSTAPCQTHRAGNGLRVRVSRTHWLLCSRCLPYGHTRPSPIAPFGGRLSVTPCECEDVPGVLPGVAGAYRPHSWGVCPGARADTHFRHPPLVAGEFLTVWNSFEPRSFVAEGFLSRFMFWCPLRSQKTLQMCQDQLNYCQASAELFQHVLW